MVHVEADWVGERHPEAEGGELIDAPADRRVATAVRPSVFRPRDQRVAVGDEPAGHSRRTVASAPSLISARSVLLGWLRCMMPSVVFQRFYGLYSPVVDQHLAIPHQVDRSEQVVVFDRLADVRSVERSTSADRPGTSRPPRLVFGSVGRQRVAVQRLPVLRRLGRERDADDAAGRSRSTRHSQYSSCGRYARSDHCAAGEVRLRDVHPLVERKRAVGDAQGMCSPPPPVERARERVPDDLLVEHRAPRRVGDRVVVLARLAAELLALGEDRLVEPARDGGAPMLELARNLQKIW